jgi:citrate lyase subunit beta/citryl-CoA lyase
LTSSPIRSWLYVPGHRPALGVKALEGEADAVVIDLEDAVPAADKDAARAEAARLLGDDSLRPAWVRVNPPASGGLEDDLVAIASPGLAGVRLPKAESSEQLDEVARLLGGAAPVHCLIESALALERAYELASHPAVTGIGLGEADLKADLGVEGDDGLLYARSRCVAAAAAAGLDPPAQSVFTDLGDVDGLRSSTQLGRRLGFFGRSAIHPTQLGPIHEVFTPTRDEIDHARELVDALANGDASALTLPDGRFVDPAVAESSRRTLALAERLGETVGK